MTIVNKVCGDYFYVDFGYGNKDLTEFFLHHDCVGWREVSGCPTGKVKFRHYWATIEGRNGMISQDFYRTDSDLSKGQISPQLRKHGFSR